jgi:hypothetical protein
MRKENLMAWGWRNSNKSVGNSPTERSRIPWLEQHGITPMNRSTRLWDMEITAHHLIPHRTERVGSLDMARTALAQQRGGHDIDPIQWQGSQSMATGRAYDWCYCIEAVQGDVDGRTACKCQCVDCKPKQKGATPTHWRKRHHASAIRANIIRNRAEGQTRRKRTMRRLDDWVWDWEHGYWWMQRLTVWLIDHGIIDEIKTKPSRDGDTLPDNEQDTPDFNEPPEWFKKKDPEEHDGSA